MYITNCYHRRRSYSSLLMDIPELHMTGNALPYPKVKCAYFNGYCNNLHAFNIIFVCMTDATAVSENIKHYRVLSDRTRGLDW
jgi:hypothetical protein